MLTNLDQELFPDDCEVVLAPPHNLQIYLIQKNGSSSLRTEAKKQNWKIVSNLDLMTLDSVDIFLRDPVDRYLSGVNTFVQHLCRDHPMLDRDTCTHMALKYSFLNRHYLPQWHWILNLVRFLTKDCVIRLHDLSELENVTQLRDRAWILPYDQAWADLVLEHTRSLELWFLLDRILLGYRGESMTWQELLAIYHRHPACPLNIISKKFQSLTHVLSKT